MRFEALKNTNITVLFSAPLQHLLINQESVVKLLETSDAEKNKHTFIEAPGLKAAIFPNQQKEVIFEAGRILINDKSGMPVADSEVVDNMANIFAQGMVESEKVAAYGFNFDAIVAAQDGFSVSDIVGSKLASLSDNVQTSGVSIGFTESDVRYGFELKELDREQSKFHAHLNVHFPSTSLPNAGSLKTSMQQQFIKFQDLVSKI